MTELTWDGASLAVAKVVPVGIADIDGPHNVTVAPDGSAWYVTIAHGTPYGALAFVANSDFHGDHPRKNVITIVQTATMTPVTNLPACDMPHGVKVNHAGTFVYVSCMNSDEILEIDHQSLRITRRPRRVSGPPPQHASVGPPIHGAPGAHDCMPTFVSVSPDDRRLYVACNNGNTLQVIDAASLELLRKFRSGPARTTSSRRRTAAGSS